MKLIGDPYWVHGPLVFGPRTLVTRLVRDFEKARPVFAAMRKDQETKLIGPRLAKVLGETVLLLCNGTPTGWVPMKNGGVLLRPLSKLGNRKAESYVVPETLDDVLIVGEDWALFDSVSGATEDDPHRKLRGKKLLSIPLAPGRYRVQHNTPAQLALLKYEAVRLMLEGADAPAVTRVKEKPGFPVDADIKKRAKSLRFITSEGGPFVGLPVASVAKWGGVEGVEGDTDYDRICNTRGLILGKDEGIIIPAPDSTALLPTDDGVVFVHWVGADSAVDLVAALPHAKRWKRFRKPFCTSGPLVLFDSVCTGRKLRKKERLDVPLKPGLYDIDTIEVQGKVEGGGEVMAGFTRLTRRR